jgi:RNA polymerase sigma-70 factor (ECF subfamily)
MEGQDAERDRAVLVRVAGGDVESFGVLVDRHEKRLFQVCYLMLGDAEEARDATQEVFLKAFRKAGSFRPEGQVFTWLYRIAVNHCLNRLRRRRIVGFLSFGEMGTAEADEPAFDPPDEGADPEARAAGRQRWRRVQAEVARLPPGQRAVFVLAKLEGLSSREVAESLGITESAVESRLVRAMRRLVAVEEKNR